MDIIPHVLLGSGNLTPFVEEIKQEFNKTVAKIIDKLPVSGIDVVIYDNPEGAIPEIGIGGYTPNTHLIFVSLDPKFPNFKQAINKELKRTIAHELHHALRWKDPGYGETLFEALITEGLADHFDMEINDTSDPEPWDMALNEKQLKEIQAKAVNEYDNKNYSHSTWFFGSKEKGIPKWSGYTLGFNLVADFLKRHPDKKPSQLYNTKPENFR